MTRLVSLACLCALGLAGCDTLRGYEMRSALDELTQPACLRTALAEVPGVEIVGRNATADDSYQIAPKMGPIHSVNERTRFTYMDREYALQVYTENELPKYALVSGMALNQCPDPAYLADFRRMSEEVGPALSSSCLMMDAMTLEQHGNCEDAP